MLTFAVTIEGLDKNELQGHWVLAVDRERVLITHDDNTLHWYPLTKCRLLKIINPEAPQPVIALQPQQRVPQIVTPRNGAQ